MNEKQKAYYKTAWCIGGIIIIFYTIGIICQSGKSHQITNQWGVDIWCYNGIEYAWIPSLSKYEYVGLPCDY